MHAEGLVRLRRAWELELAAEATRRSSPATALEMIGALRRAGVPWSEIVKQRAIREGVMRGADGIWSVVADAAAAATAPATKAAKNLAASARAMVPTLALRHAGGSWSDVVSHPAFRFLGRERHEVMKALFVSGPVARTPARAPLPLPLPLREGGAPRPAVPRAARGAGDVHLLLESAETRGVLVAGRRAPRLVPRVRARARGGGGLLGVPGDVRPAAVHHRRRDVGV
jgi:hypothetical protein